HDEFAEQHSVKPTIPHIRRSIARAYECLCRSLRLHDQRSDSAVRVMLDHVAIVTQVRGAILDRRECNSRSTDEDGARIPGVLDALARSNRRVGVLSYRRSVRTCHIVEKELRVQANAVRRFHLIEVESWNDRRYFVPAIIFRHRQRQLVLQGHLHAVTGVDPKNQWFERPCAGGYRGKVIRIDIDDARGILEVEILVVQDALCSHQVLSHPSLDREGPDWRRAQSSWAAIDALRYWCQTTVSGGQ